MAHDSRDATLESTKHKPREYRVQLESPGAPDAHLWRKARIDATLRDVTRDPRDPLVEQACRPIEYTYEFSSRLTASSLMLLSNSIKTGRLVVLALSQMCLSRNSKKYGMLISMSIQRFYSEGSRQTPGTNKMLQERCFYCNY